MKPEYTTNSGNSAISNKKSSEEGCLINDSKCKDEGGLDGFSSEFLSKINSFFEIHNSILYEDVHENASSLEKYLSADLSSEAKMTGNCSDENETAEDEKSLSDNSQKLYSSLRRYKSEKKSLKNPHSFEIEKKIAIPDSFQLPILNEARNIVTFDASLSENNMIDIEFPTYNSFGSSQILTDAQKSIRLNKKSSLKKSIKKSTNEKVTVPHKTEECFNREEVISTSVVEKPDLKKKLYLKKNSKHVTNEEMIIPSKTEDYFNPTDVVFKDLTGKSKTENKKSLKKNIKKSTKEKVIVPCKADKCFNPKEKVSKNMIEKSGVKNKKLSVKRNLKKSTNKEMTVPSKTEECLSSTDEISRGLSAKSKLENKTPVLRGKKSKTTKEKVIVPCKTEQYFNSKEIIIRDMTKRHEFENKNSSLRKNTKKLTKEEMEEPCKMEESLDSKEVVSKGVTKINKLKTELKKTLKKELKNAHGNLKVDSSLSFYYGLTHTEEQTKELRVTLTDILEKHPDFKEQLKNDEKAIFKFSDESQKKITSEVKSTMKKKTGKTSKKVQNKSVSGKHSPQNKTSLSKVKNCLNKTNDSEKDSFIPALQSVFINQPKLSENFAKMEEEKLLKKNKSKLGDQLAKKPGDELSLKKQGVSRKKSISQNNAKMKFKDSLLENKGNFNENDGTAKDLILLTNKSVNDLKHEIITADKNLQQNSKSKSAEIFQASTLVFQNSFIRNTISNLNKSIYTSPLSGGMTHKSSFLQLFNKVIQSSGSEAHSKSNPSIAKLFEQCNNSKLETSSEISKELGEKQNREELLQLNSSKGNDNNPADLKSFEAVLKKTTKSIPLGKKRPNENNSEVTSKKKKLHQELIKKILKGEISSEEDYIKNCDAGTLKRQQFNNIVIDKPPQQRSSKRNHKLQEEYLGRILPVPNSSKYVRTDLQNQERSVNVKNAVENMNSPTKSYSENQPTNVMQLVTKKSCSKIRQSTTDKYIGSQNSHKRNRKSDSLISAKPEPLCNDEAFDACSLLKVTDVRSLANLSKKENNLKKKKSNSLMPASYSDDPKASKSNKLLPVSGQKNKRKTKHLHSPDLSLSEEKITLEFNSVDKTVAKSKRRSRDNKSVSNLTKKMKSSIVKSSQNTNIRCSGKNFINEMSNVTILEESVNEENAYEESANEESTNKECVNKELIRNYTNEELAYDINSSIMSLNNFTVEQLKEIADSFALFPLNILGSSRFSINNIPCTSLHFMDSQVFPSNLTANNNTQVSQQPFQVQNYPIQNFPISHFISSPQYTTLNPTIRNPGYVQQQNFHSVVNSSVTTSAVSDQSTPSVFAANAVPPILASQAIPPVLVTQNVPSLMTDQNILAKVKPQTALSSLLSQYMTPMIRNSTCIQQQNPQSLVNSHNAIAAVSGQNTSSAVSPQNTSVAIAAQFPGTSSPHSFINSTSSAYKIASTQNTVLNITRSTTTPTTLDAKMQPMVDKWHSILLESMEGVDFDYIEGAVKKLTGENYHDNKIEDFFSIPQVEEEVSKIVGNTNFTDDSDYNLQESILKEPIIHIIKDFIECHMEPVYEALKDKSGEDLKNIFFYLMYAKYSVSTCYFVGGILKDVSKLSLKAVAGAFGLYAIILLFNQFRKNVR